MQAVLKAAAAEATRSLSTAVIIWAGAPTCPACPEHQRCPDCHCVCQDGARISPRAIEAEACGWTSLALALFVGVLLGSLGQQLLTHHGTVRGRAVQPRAPAPPHEAVTPKAAEAVVSDT